MDESVCEYLTVCPFFNETLDDMPATVQLIKNKYCLSDYSCCARYRVSTEVGAEHVPDSLFPKNSEEAETIILRSKSE